MLIMVCRLGEGVLGAIGIPNTLGLLWLATGGDIVNHYLASGATF
jgi:hypothetical protein